MYVEGETSNRRVTWMLNEPTHTLPLKEQKRFVRSVEMMLLQAKRSKRFRQKIDFKTFSSTLNSMKKTLDSDAIFAIISFLSSQELNSSGVAKTAHGVNKNIDAKRQHRVVGLWSCQKVRKTGCRRNG